LALLAVMAVVAGYFLSANFDTLWPGRTAPSVADARNADPQEATQPTPNDEVASAGSRSAPSGDSAAATPDPQKTVAEPTDADRPSADTAETPRATEDRSASGSQLPASGRSGGQAAPNAETRGEITSERRAQSSAPPAQREPAPPAATTDRRQTAPVESDPRQQRPVEPEPAPLPSAADPVGEPPADDVSGSWTMINQVASTSYNRFKDLKIGYRLQLEQTGNRVTGHGLKWMENGREIASGSRTPITLDGIIEGRRLELRFSERGTRRASGGMFLMQLADDGSLHGTFTSDAARSSGSSQARRMNSARE
jgi:hypothetical protein